MQNPQETTGEQPSIRELYDRYAAKVYGRCLYLLRNEQEAEDAMHDVFIKAMRNMEGFRQEAAPLTWLTRIATNHCLNLIRAKKAAWHDKYKSEVKTHVKSEVSDGIRFAEDDQLLRLCLNQVDKELAELAIYYFVDEMTQADICELAGMSAPTLRKRLRAFVQQARDVIQAEMPGVDFRPSLV